MSNVAIKQIPPILLVHMAPFIGPYLARGLPGSGRDPLDIAADIARDHNQVWAIFEKGSVVGAFLTAIVVKDDDGERVLDIFGLAGDGAPRWGRHLSDLMHDYAKANDCKRFVFDGKYGWLRACGHTVQVAGRKNARMMIFERRVA